MDLGVVSQSVMKMSNIQPRQVDNPASKKYPLAAHLRNSARTHYEMTVAMLNDSMGLCLR